MSNPVTVLLIEDDPDYVTLVQTWLASSKKVEFIVNWADTLLAGMDHIAKGKVDLILLDLSLPDSDGPQTFEVVRRRAHGIPVVLLSGNDGESVALNLVRAGAQDYLVKSRCTAEILIRAILYAVVRQPSKEGAEVQPARVLGLLAAKGGVGLTTLACILGTELRQLDQGAVLLADFNVHANGASFLLGLNPTYTLLDALANMHRLDEANWSSIVSETPENLYVLPSPVLYGRSAPEPEKLRQLLNRLSMYYSWIVLDLGHLNSTSLALLESAHEVTVVTSTSVASLYETRQALAVLRSAGWEGDKLRMAVVEMPGSPRLSEASLQEMVGFPVGLLLPESSADLVGLGAIEGLLRKGSPYRECVARFARQLSGTPEEKPTTKGLAGMLGFR